VVADESAPPDYVAIDLMAQAEHGPNGAALLVTWSESLAAAVAESVERLLAESSRRADTEATLRSGGSIVLVDGPEQAMEVANIVAPEHLELMNADPAAPRPPVRHARAQVDVAVRLNTNESPYPPPPEFFQAWTAEVSRTSAHRYPDRAARRLRAALGGFLDQPAERVFCANGSNEVLQTLLLGYGGPGRT